MVSAAMSKKWRHRNTPITESRENPLYLQKESCKWSMVIHSKIWHTMDVFISEFDKTWLCPRYRTKIDPKNLFCSVKEGFLFFMNKLRLGKTKKCKKIYEKSSSDRFRFSIPVRQINCGTGARGLKKAEPHHCRKLSLFYKKDFFNIICKTQQSKQWMFLVYSIVIMKT